MAENRNITWNIKLVVNSNVTTVIPLNLYSQNLDWGKFMTNPPSQIKVDGPGKSTTASFKAAGAECSATGTEGTVVFKASDQPVDADKTTFTFKWDIPFSAANSGNATMTTNTNYFTIDNGGGVPVSGNSVSVDVTITQVGPII
jgi:Aegerolysin